MLVLMRKKAFLKNIEFVIASFANAKRGNPQPKKLWHLPFFRNVKCGTNLKAPSLAEGVGGGYFALAKA